MFKWLSDVDRNHLMSFTERMFNPIAGDEFLLFAAQILSDPAECEYYLQEGWLGLADKYFRQR